MLKVLICEDDYDYLCYLQGFISSKLKIPYALNTCATGGELAQYIRNMDDKIDVVLMDIQLKEENGIDLALELKKRCSDLKIIFISGYINDYLEGLFLKVKPYGIFRKPLDEGKILELLNQVKCECEKEQKEFLLKNGRGDVKKIRISDIDYVESLKREVFVHMQDRTERCYNKLSYFEKNMPENFLRCHKSYLVNMDRITEIIGNTIKLYNGEVVNVSRRKNAETKERYFQFMADKLL